MKYFYDNALISHLILPKVKPQQRKKPRIQAGVLTKTNEKSLDFVVLRFY